MITISCEKTRQLDFNIKRKSFQKLTASSYNLLCSGASGGSLTTRMKLIMMMVTMGSL